MQTYYITFFLLLFSLSLSAQDGEYWKGQFYQAMPMPNSETTPVVRNFDNEQISFNSTTGEIKHETINLDSGLAEGLQEGKTLGQATESSHSNRIFNSLSIVSNPEAYPNRVNVKLFMNFSDNYFVCSGVLIDAKHVLTAGHCIYNHSHGGWPTSVTIVPAYDNGLEPYGSADEIQFHSWTGWTVNQDYNWDMGYIFLDRPIGGLTGWHGYGYNTANSYFTSNNWINPGYPAESPYNGQDMYTWNGTFDVATANLLSHNNLGYGGQSGSGTHIINSGSRYVYSVASHTAVDGNGNRIPPLTHCRMVEARFNNIQSTIATHRPDNADMIPLQTFVEPLTINTGQPFDSLTIRAINYSDAAFIDALSISFYLSTNNIISSSDILLETFSWSSSTINPLGSFYGNIPDGVMPLIPNNINGGTYYVGAIINNTDDNTANNATSAEDVVQIFVNKVYCNGVTEYNSPTRTFTDGSEPLSSYGNNSDCRWIVNPFGADSITLNISTLNLESGYDFLKVYGDISETNLLWQGSGSVIPPEIVATGDEMVIHFTSDGSVAFQGFEATYTTNLPSYCSNGNVLTDSTGIFSDGSASNNYANYSFCGWLIDRPDAHHISLVFDTIDIESGYDFIRVYDGADENAPLLTTLSGNHANVQYNSTGSQLYIVFETDYSVTDYGWEAHYFSVPEFCQGNATLNTPAGYFSDGSGILDYNINSSCYWEIAPAGALQVALNFTQLNVEFGYDFVTVFDGNSIYDSVLGVFTGDTLPSTLTSTGGTMLIEFQSDYIINSAGFDASFHGLYPNGCIGSDIVLGQEPLPGGTYSTNSSILSASEVSNSQVVVFNAGDSVVLGQGFYVETGSELQIGMNGCP